VVDRAPDFRLSDVRDKTRFIALEGFREGALPQCHSPSWRRHREPDLTPDLAACVLETGVDVAALLIELYGRIPPLARHAVEDIPVERLTEVPASGTNPIGWLVWHLTRVQDHHVAELLDTDQVWVGEGWASRFGLDPDPSNIGYGHSAEEVAAVRPEGPEALLDYLDEVGDRTRAMLKGLAPADLDRIVDQRWDPPVTLGVRLVSIADDSLQHAGQAAYLRGLLGL
jgi:hypothetical protein